MAKCKVFQNISTYSTIRSFIPEKVIILSIIFLFQEAMKIMGLPSWLHWLAWFLKSFSYLMISIILIIILLKVRWYKNTEYTVFTYASPAVLFIFLMFYICATITFCFAISVFFSKGKCPQHLNFSNNVFTTFSKHSSYNSRSGMVPILCPFFVPAKPL